MQHNCIHWRKRLRFVVGTFLNNAITQTDGDLLFTTKLHIV